MQYTRQEIVNKCQQTFDDIESFYKQPFVNYIGRTTDTNEYYTEVIAEFLIDNLDKYIYGISKITRESSYKKLTHTGIFDINTPREESVENISEEQLEDIAVDFLKNYSGPVFIMMSAMNVDRVITAKNIAKRTNRVFLQDIYTADITTSIGITTENTRVFMTGGNNQYEKLKKYPDIKIGKNEISKTPFIMCVRSSMKNYLLKLNELVSFENGVLFYGMWKGYLEKPQTKEFVEFMENKRVKTHILHTSGHADSMTIDKLIKDVKPKRIIPVHTENAKWFDKY